MNIDFKFFIGVFLRRLPIFLVVVAFLTSLGLSVALLLPPQYRTTATMLVEQEQIPESLAASTVQTATAEQLRIIEQRLFARERLLQVANQLDLFRDPETGERILSASDIVSAMRRNTEFDLQTAGNRRRGGGGTAILRISYSGEDPVGVAAVVNELVTLVLEENLAIRTAQAGETLDFFQQEVERLNTELDAQSARLLEFQSKAGIATPENETFLRGRLSSLEDRLAQRSQEYARLEDQRERLVQLFETTGGLSQEPTRSPLERELAAAREELFDAQVIYSDQNPRLRVLEARVEQLEQRIARASEVNADADLAASEERRDQARVLFDTQLSEIDAQLSAIEDERASVQAEMETVTAQIAEATQNGFTIAKLERDLNGIQTDFRIARDRLSAAQTGERIELLAKGQRISLVEQAIVPSSPISPNRPLIAAAGFGGGIAAGLGLIVLLELLNKSIRRPVELTQRLGITPIGVVPYIRTDREIAIKRAVVAVVVAFLLIGVPALLLLVHSFVTPLDGLLEPLVNRLGYSIGG